MIPDGFAYHSNYLQSPLDYTTFCLGQLDLLRRAAAFRPYMVQLPDDQNLILPAYSNWEYQMHFRPGSWLYGMVAMIYTSGGALTTANNQISVQISESYSGLQLFSEFVDLVTVYARQSLSDEPRIILLPEPRAIPAPGDYDIEVCNLTGSNIQWRIVLLCAEPYEEVEA